MSTGRRLKSALYRSARRLGGFRAARRATRNKLRILCYHGLSHRDEHEFEPFLFMRPDTFERRLDTLVRHRTPVISLDDAVAGLQRGDLPPGATVITVDDGFRRTLTHAAPALAARGLPATVYVTSYYVERPHPIFRLVTRYACWKSRVERLDPASLGVPGLPPVDLRDKRDLGARIEPLIRYGQDQLDEPSRRALGWRVCETLGVDAERLRQSGVMTLMSRAEVTELAERGVDVQLHSHCHDLADEDADGIGADLDRNLAVLRPLTQRPLRHFCYPSGIWAERFWPPLQARGVVSATTCEPGLNGSDTPLLALKRFVDAETVSELEFEAELTGFAPVLRGLSGKLRGG